MDKIRPTPAEIDSLKAFSFIEDDLITRLKEELPRYKVAAEDVSQEMDTNTTTNKLSFQNESDVFKCSLSC